MKLRVKQTGKTIDVHSIDYLEGDATILVRYYTEDGYPDYYDFNSLKELSDTLEDYRPAEPLTRDEEVKKLLGEVVELELTINELSKRFDEFNKHYVKLCGEEEK